MESIEQLFSTTAAFMWGTPLVCLLVGGGVFFALHSGFWPYRNFAHAGKIVTGAYDKEGGSGDISHFQALMVALSGTLGLGNITGVALAISIGGPGAVFWMWVSALLGIATKFYTASLSIMYRGKDSRGELQGGPMYVVREGLGEHWKPLAYLFCIGGIFGMLPVFQINQLVQILREFVAVPLGVTAADQHFTFDFVMGLLLFGLVSCIVFGKLKRIAAVTSRVVPFMVITYFLMTMVLLYLNASKIPTAFILIFTDAFSGQAVVGGAIGAVILIGVQRGAFSNEAGIGTESMAHGAAKTNEPIREGLVAMIGPVVDTLIVCTCTALAILVTDTWQSGLTGISITAQAYENTFPQFGAYLLAVVVFFLSVSTVVSFWYYGTKCTNFLAGHRFEKYYIAVYLILIVAGAVFSLKVVIGLIDTMYAVMAIPTMTSALLLAPKVKQATRAYAKRLRAEG